MNKIENVCIAPLYEKNSAKGENRELKKIVFPIRTVSIDGHKLEIRSGKRLVLGKNREASIIYCSLVTN